jgi:hypothetical protein
MGVVPGMNGVRIFRNKTGIWAGSTSGVPTNFVQGAVQQIQLRTERTGILAQ